MFLGRIQSSKCMERQQPLTLSAKGCFLCGLDGTRTRDPLRDRLEFSDISKVKNQFNILIFRYLIDLDVFWFGSISRKSLQKVCNFYS
ncbi:hypothetical protein D7Z94_13200 [Ulvibacterium marinum]|uniref:Uncharacterized protein n=1 Tax=Ulvibacterium marinum TaxID=2419782 RepID=A0A3B0C4C4_9FLAO|nr:hypothetical protein D7Z94_13200 [Ulvibacterium marinum]